MLAIIGGTGLYDLAGMDIEARIDAATPFGAASGAVVRGRVGGQQILFLARHGGGHRLLPHEVNYRANIFALKRAGATMLLGFSAVAAWRNKSRPASWPCRRSTSTGPVATANALSSAPVRPRMFRPPRQ